MQIKISQLGFDVIELMDFDIVIAASGFELRSSFQMSKWKGNAKKKVALCFKSEKNNKNRKINDEFFTERGFALLEELSYETFFDDLFQFALENRIADESLTIYCDYSSMSRTMYAELLLAARRRRGALPIHIFMGYSHALYEATEKNDILNRVVEPIPGFCELSIPHKPTALIICLGNEISRVYGLKEFFDASTYLFYSDPQFGNQFSLEVESINEDILRESPPERIFKFPLEDLLYTDQLLENLCKSLQEDYRVVLAPCGPKPFTLLALLNSMKLEKGIETWRISPDDGIQVFERKPSEKISLLHVSIDNYENELCENENGS